MDAPFESAKTRRLLALAHRFSGDEASAGMELRVAKDASALHWRRTGATN
jgi:hypothetical protein